MKRSASRARVSDRRKLEQLRRAIDAGVTALERGDHVEIDFEELDRFLADLGSAARTGSSS